MDARTYFFLPDPGRCPTPALAFDRAVIRRKVSALLALEAEHRCHFLMAVKSFPIRRVIRTDFHRLSGFDVSNLPERRLLPPRLPRKTLWVTDPTGAAIKDLPALRRGVRQLVVTCETPDDLIRGSRLDRRAQWAIRVKVNRRSDTGLRSRFGAEGGKAFREAWARVPRATLRRVEGFHIHGGFGPSSAADYTDSARKVMRLARELEIEPRLLNLGGGLGALREADWSRVIGGIRKVVPAQTELFFEPGRMLTESAGYAIGTIQRVRETDGSVECVLDLSRSCHLRWAKPTWMRAAAERASTGGAAREVRWFGPTCSEYDRIGESRLESTADATLLREGSRVVFSRVPGYSLAWNHAFNGIPAAGVFLVQDGKISNAF